MSTEIYCCPEFERFYKSLITIAIVIKEDLSIDRLGYHEPIRDDIPTEFKIKFCPFCGTKL